MSDLEKLVPPLELCKQIPVGKFVDSVLIWKHGAYSAVVDERLDGCEPWLIAPAPTLAEILEKLYAMFDEGDVCVWNTAVHGEWGVKLVNLGRGRFVHSIEYDANPATAALKLWMEVTKEETAND